MRTASIIMAMMEAVSTSETSVNFNMNTRRYIPEYPKLQILSAVRKAANTNFGIIYHCYLDGRLLQFDSELYCKQDRSQSGVPSCHCQFDQLK
jgi:hypothetical protein